MHRAKNAAHRLDAVDWNQIETKLDQAGYALTEKLLTANECRQLRSLYTQNELFRSRVVMARHGFGQGEYRYFSYPLPEIVQVLRETLYPRLVNIANRWQKISGAGSVFSKTLDKYLDRCHRAGQLRPTPLLLKYGSGDFNCLHQDLYGDLYFRFR